MLEKYCRFFAETFRLLYVLVSCKNTRYAIDGKNVAILSYNIVLFKVEASPAAYLCKTAIGIIAISQLRDICINCNPLLR